MMNSYFYSAYGEMSPLVFLLVAVDLILKGVTLYKSARREQKVWFVALLLINSMGILPVIYLFVSKDIQLFRKTKKTKK